MEASNPLRFWKRGGLNLERRPIESRLITDNFFLVLLLLLLLLGNCFVKIENALAALGKEFFLFPAPVAPPPPLLLVRVILLTYLVQVLLLEERNRKKEQGGQCVLALSDQHKD